MLECTHACCLAQVGTCGAKAGSADPDGGRHALLQAGQVLSTLNAQLDLPSRDDVRLSWPVLRPFILQTLFIAAVTRMPTTVLIPCTTCEWKEFRYILCISQGHGSVLLWVPYTHGASRL